MTRAQDIGVMLKGAAIAALVLAIASQLDQYFSNGRYTDVTVACCAKFGIASECKAASVRGLFHLSYQRRLFSCGSPPCATLVSPRPFDGVGGFSFPRLHFNVGPK